jgi:Holliday junction resolvasome RuvABC DNA-binding subunit
MKKKESMFKELINVSGVGASTALNDFIIYEAS